MCCVIFSYFSFFRYDPQLLVQYNINCGEGRLAHINITSLDLEGAENCVDGDGNSRYDITIHVHNGFSKTNKVQLL